MFDETCLSKECPADAEIIRNMSHVARGMEMTRRFTEKNLGLLADRGQRPRF